MPRYSEMTKKIISELDPWGPFVVESMEDSERSEAIYLVQGGGEPSLIRRSLSAGILPLIGQDGAFSNARSRRFASPFGVQWSPRLVLDRTRHLNVIKRLDHMSNQWSSAQNSAPDPEIRPQGLNAVGIRLNEWTDRGIGSSTRLLRADIHFIQPPLSYSEMVSTGWEKRTITDSQTLSKPRERTTMANLAEEFEKSRQEREIPLSKLYDMLSKSVGNSSAAQKLERENLQVGEAEEEK